MFDGPDVSNIALNVNEIPAVGPHYFGRASVWGELTNQILDKPIVISRNRSGQRKDGWKSPDAPTAFGNFLETLSEHAEGQKEGRCFIQGKLGGVTRKANAVEALHLLGLDLDSGEDFDEVRRRIQDMGLFAVLYTTYSNGKAETAISRDALVAWLSKSDKNISADNITLKHCQQYLTEMKGYRSAIVESATGFEDKFGTNGPEFVVRHAPMQKFRVVFLLDKPFKPADLSRGKSLRGGQQAWKARYLGAANLLDVHPDVSCADVARLLYYPRHAKGTPAYDPATAPMGYRVEIVAGRALDIDSDIQPVDLKPGSVWGDVARDLGAKDGAEAQTKNLKKFAAKYADRFAVEEFFRDYGEERGSATEGTSFACPNAENHSTPDDGTDTAFYCVNAADSSSGSFKAGCLHETCKRTIGDRLGYVDLLCQQNEIRDAKELLEYVDQLEGEADDKGWDDAPREDVSGDATTAGGEANAGGVELPSGFKLDQTGLKYRKKPSGGGESHWEWICSPFEILGTTRDPDGQGWGLLLTWKDADGRDHRYVVERRMLHGGGVDIAAVLSDRGLRVSPSQSETSALKKALALAWSPHRVLLTRRGGWVDGAPGTFVMPTGEVFAADPGAAACVELASAALGKPWASSGTLGDWQREIGTPCVGNSRLTFAVSAAFAGPLLDALGEPSGGLHFYGQSKRGKSVLVFAAASVWGRAEKGALINSWRTTSNGLEGVAEQSNDLLLILDELGQNTQAEDVSSIAYMIANGGGKQRAQVTGEAKAVKTWRVMLLSTGEPTIAQKLTAGGLQMPAGVDVRIPSIPGAVGDGTSAFETLHGAESLKAFSESFYERTKRYYGCAGRAFLSRLVVNMRAEGFVDRCRAFMADVERDMLGEEADAQVATVARRFALVALAGEVASEWRILPWEQGQAEDAAKKCFAAWLADRGGAGSGEADAGLKQVRSFLIAHGASRFEELHSDPKTKELSESDNPRTVINRVGWRWEVPGKGWAYAIPPATFEDVVCAGTSAKPLLKRLAEEGHLYRNDGAKLAAKLRIPGQGRLRAYVILPSVMSDAGEGD
jgi:uncharacterized protein (DUF927 family)